MCIINLTTTSKTMKQWVITNKTIVDKTHSHKILKIKINQEKNKGRKIDRG